MAVIVTVLFVPVGLVLWARWYWTLLAAPHLARPYHRRWLLLITPILCCVGIAATEALHKSVIANANNMYLYAAIYEFGLLGVLQVTFPFFGISPLADGFARDNQAARLVVVGALVGATLAFASAATATKVPSLYGIFDLAALMVYLTAWSIVEKCTRLSDRVTVCRDVDSGVRLAGILTGCGLASGLAMSAVNESPQRLIPAAAALLVLVVLILFVELAVFRSRRLSHEFAARRFLSIVAATAYVGLGYFFVISAR